MLNKQDLSLEELMNEKDLTLVATCFLQDQLREEVPNAVKTLKRAGVTTRMITGDSSYTAKAIAIKTGIIGENEEEAITTGYVIA